MKQLVFVLLIAVSGNLAQAKAALPAEARQILTEQGSVQPAEAAPAALAVAEAPVAKAETAVNLKESEIPLNLDKKKETAADSSPLARFLAGMLIVAALGIGAFFYLRKNAKPGQRKNAPQIKVLSQHWLGPKKSLAIVRVAGESVLIGVTDHNISMIKSLALLDEDVPSDAPEKFEEVLEESETRSTRTPKTSANAITTAEDEEFQMGGLNQIKDAVHRRLKGMRTWQ